MNKQGQTERSYGQECERQWTKETLTRDIYLKKQELRKGNQLKNGICIYLRRD